VLITATDDVFLEPAQKCGKSSPSAKSNDAVSTREGLRFGRDFLHRMT
jgi:hypothetical protein